MQEKETSSFGSTSADVTEIGDGTETERTVEVKLTANRAVSVTFDLGEITPRVRKSISSIADADEDKAEGAMIDLLDRIVVKWDYKTRKGVNVSPTSEEIAEAVSLRDLSAIVTGIFQGSSQGN